MSAPTPQLADQEMAALVKVEAEFARRSQGGKPWTTREYLDEIEAVHVRFNRFRQFQLKAVA
ncbi:hypothetical protein ACFXD5_12170 [Streptomyces sp. NPDC059385]|uniref:hypothetical protein n=1 Tax=Streptomyces sp. NPDC059385 TaxID=3346817 RepID=UPI0036A154BE